MAQSEQTDSPPPTPPSSVHRGSASTTLNGRTVVLVWLVSAALHCAGLAIMFSLVFPFVSRGQAELPVARLDIVGPVDRPPVIPLPLPEMTNETTTPDPLDARLAPERTDRLSDLATAKRPELSIIGIGAGGGDFSKYGLTAGSGSGPEFFGLGGAARGVRRIVYVVDRSGSMLDTFEYVRVELKRSINELRRSQRFHVIFFNTGEPLENPPKRLVSAIKAQKEAFFKFLEGIYPAGSTRPARAMRRAFAAEPDLIYFLTDGAFDPELVRKLNKWNKGHRVRIFTIAFFDRSGAALLERIAREHGGEFKFVSENDLP